MTGYARIHARTTAEGVAASETALCDEHVGFTDDFPGDAG